MMIINFINNTEENSTLPIRLLFVALLSFVLSAPAYAGGSHGGHSSRSENSYKKPAKQVYSEKYTRHAEGHDKDESPVGRPAAQQEATMLINVAAFDTMRYAFSPAPYIKPGDVVKFVITNKGGIPHEFSIGDEQEQAKHREMMQKMPKMVHQDASTVTIEPGKTEVLTWKFNTAGVVIACNIPGHFEAGMFKNITLN
ncbi:MULTISPECIES: cupredoxin domain-containing protein [Cycloclasticus]|jgi:uncharacterized cupredoxin-like copper-binding protein|uniref:Copper-binding protein n=1 Tax=Cycloclasticus zancles 78-ME TaxID=1198232 RepID=S5T762_9GAMM|nr:MULTISPECIES: putative copper-binding protein [Cycloclasticus]AGS39621.1 Copper-binding protein [Cycloclasticus zancles 78-ME]MBV1898417.1 hypothetical protein [Cycloclasticus sp.]MDF1690266.1 hypothetical protein [Cycloclasticus sp.]|tara:strand:+ start:3479 stop:4072 length:594 start_codon:yes stop_codon:yes gene_type:complete